jgi:aspartyl-tRNA(Asn)/glutamyl-tRNA(Gln) amidotransferase subunit C
MGKMKIDVSHIAKLANLPLTKEEKEKLGKQLDETLEHIASLQKIDTKNIEPTSQVTGLENVTREDIVTPSLSQKEALQNARDMHKGYIKVKAIIEEE